MNIMMTKLHRSKSKNYSLGWGFVLHRATQTICFNVPEHRNLTERASRKQPPCGKTRRGSSSYVTSKNTQ